MDKVFCCQRLAKEEEPRGFIYVSAGRGPVVIFGALFASVAINEFARASANCEGTVLGGLIKASSVLSSLGAIEGVLNAVLSPFMGTFADLTPYRKIALMVSFLTFVILVIVQGCLFLSEPSTMLDPSETSDDPNAEPVYLPIPLWNSDLALVILLASVVLQVVAYEVAALLTVTYSSELCTDEVQMTGYVSMAYTVLNGMQLFSAALLTGLSFVFGFNSFEIGTYGAFIVAFITLCWFIPGYPKLGERREVNEELKRGCCGLLHLAEALKDIVRDYRQLFKLLISWMLASASLSSITSLSTSYLQFHLGYKGITTSALLSLALLFSVPGSLLTKYLVARFDLRRVYVGILTIFGLSFIVAPLVLVADSFPINTANSTEPLTQFGRCVNATLLDQDETYQEAPGYILFVTAFFTALWGTGIGCVYVANNALYASLIPGARETSFFGIKVTFAKIFTAVPPAVFTYINENTDLLQYAILVLAPFFLAAAFTAYLIDFEKGKEDVAHTLHLRRGEGYKEVSGTAGGGRVMPGKLDEDLAGSI
mmetsp:Transcript_2567/g.3806  ORF Transcript_2567/g.3806 Transcript_2567/m.3806 type:complete len:540 (+) Transcript_2567:106-1725(+)|eukprot:CAMPEP_0171466016 /NCGR_PEP_ID=MMETSP0945-20130129/8927_1 /TAXON_ID=109269 /ORGANISM="Vaucheria litorea, Strain CCMP2940" /LENGTH=539 /DNA_ID=CAMNT_0011993867 /DNA_START=103 /DNA_END=1722 /DNA_ORIENTATION=-